MIELSILVPCYHEEANLSELMRRLQLVAEPMGYNYEIVLVDDGSKDGTWAGICALARQFSVVRGYRLSRNFGHQLAVSAGLAMVRGERVLIIDADLQDPPELLPTMMAKMDAGVDNVYGKRLSHKDVPFIKKWTAWLFYRVLGFLAGYDIPADTGDFRLINRRVLNVINSMPEQQRFLRGMMSWAGYRQEAVEYHRDGRFAGEPGYTLIKSLSLAIDGITSFSIKPLRVATMFGLLVGLAAMVFAGYVVVATLFFDHPVQGWASLMVAILMVGSLQLFVLGIIGEYLGGLFLEGKRRPLYVISEETERIKAD